MEACPRCGRLPLADDPAARAALLDDIRDRQRDRLLSVEAWMRTSSTDDRVAVVRWLRQMLSRPPLRDRTWSPQAALLAAVAGDMELWAIDPLSPMTEAGMVPVPHPLLAEPLETNGADPAPLREALRDALS